MPAELFDFYFHQAYCADCGWEGGIDQSQEACQQEADDHNARHHNGRLT